MRRNVGLAGARPSITFLILMITALPERRLSLSHHPSPGIADQRFEKSLKIFCEGTADYTDFTDKDSRSVAKTTALR